MSPRSNYKNDFFSNSYCNQQVQQVINMITFDNSVSINKSFARSVIDDKDVVHMKDNDYINITNLLTKVGKKFYEWGRIQGAERIINIVKEQTGLSKEELIIVVSYEDATEVTTKTVNGKKVTVRQNQKITEEIQGTYVHLLLHQPILFWASATYAATTMIVMRKYILRKNNKNIGELEEKYNLLKEEHAAEIAELEEHHEDILELRLGRKSKKIKEGKERGSSLVDKVTSLEDQLRELMETTNKVYKNTSRIIEKNEETHKKLDSSNKKLDKASKKLDDSNKKLDDSNKKADTLKEEVTTVKEEARSDAKKASKEREELSEKIDENTTRINILTDYVVHHTESQEVFGICYANDSKRPGLYRCFSTLAKGVPSALKLLPSITRRRNYLNKCISVPIQRNSRSTSRLHSPQRKMLP